MIWKRFGCLVGSKLIGSVGNIIMQHFKPEIKAKLLKYDRN